MQTLQFPQIGLPEMDAHILHFLDGRTLLGISTLNTYTHSLLTKEFWLKAIQRLYPTFPTQNVDSPIDILNLLVNHETWKMSEWAIDTQNIEVLTWMDQTNFYNPGQNMLEHALSFKIGDQFSKVLKWLVEEHNIIPDEMTLMGSYDETWLNFCDQHDASDCNIKKWLLETFDIKMNDDDDF